MGAVQSATAEAVQLRAANRRARSR